MDDKSKIILEFFKGLNDSNIEYVLLRNVNNELPYNYTPYKKDIDVMVRPEHRSRFHAYMKKNKYVSSPHPLDKGSGTVYLYAVYPFEFYKKNGVYIDVCYQLVCKSPNAGEYLPIDMLINSSAWENRKIDQQYGWYVLCEEDLLVHLLTRCIFDKKRFEPAYVSKIDELLKIVDMRKLTERLNVVFFRFTPTLLAKLNNHDYSTIRKEYFSFVDY